MYSIIRFHLIHIWVRKKNLQFKFEKIFVFCFFFPANLNNYDPNQQSQTYVVAQGSASSGNPNLFPQGLINYYTNIFNPNVNTQFLQNANPPNKNYNPNLQQQQGQMNYGSIGIPVSR
jgi:hypothetical protein